MIKLNLTLLFRLLSADRNDSRKSVQVDGVTWPDLETYVDWLEFQNITEDVWHQKIAIAIRAQIEQDPLLKNILLQTGNYPLQTDFSKSKIPGFSEYCASVYDSIRTEFYEKRGFSSLFYAPPEMRFANFWIDVQLHPIMKKAEFADQFSWFEQIAFMSQLGREMAEYHRAYQNWKKQLPHPLKLLFAGFFEGTRYTMLLFERESFLRVPVYGQMKSSFTLNRSIQIWNRLIWKELDALLLLGINKQYQLEQFRAELIWIIRHAPETLESEKNLSDLYRRSIANDREIPVAMDHNANSNGHSFAVEIQECIQARFAQPSIVKLAIGKHIFEETCSPELIRAIIQVQRNLQNAPDHVLDIIVASKEQLLNVPIDIPLQFEMHMTLLEERIDALRTFWNAKLRSEAIEKLLNGELTRLTFRDVLIQRLALERYVDGVRGGIFRFERHHQQLQLLASQIEVSEYEWTSIEWLVPSQRIANWEYIENSKGIEHVPMDSDWFLQHWKQWEILLNEMMLTNVTTANLHKEVFEKTWECQKWMDSYCHHLSCHRQFIGNQIIEIPNLDYDYDPIFEKFGTKKGGFDCYT